MNLTLYLNRLVSSSRYGLSAEMGSSVPFRAKFRSLQSLQTRPTRREARGSAAAQQRSSTAAPVRPGAAARWRCPPEQRSAERGPPRGGQRDFRSAPGAAFQQLGTEPPTSRKHAQISPPLKAVGRELLQNR